MTGARRFHFTDYGTKKILEDGVESVRHSFCNSASLEESRLMRILAEKEFGHQILTALRNFAREKVCFIEILA